MTFKSLYELIPSPILPIETGSVEEWLAVEKILNVVLPNDYKQYINTFGTGCIGAFLWPLNPFSKNEYLNLLKSISTTLDGLRELKKKWGDRQCPYPLYPERGGLLPWGITDNGDVLFWLMEGDSNEWLVVINEARAPVYEEYRESMTSFLIKLILGEINSAIIPSNFLHKNTLFISQK